MSKTDGINFERVHSAQLVILTDGRHFRCIKNIWAGTWADREEKECIPNSLMRAYIMQYADNFTVEDLVDSLIYEMAT